MTDTVASDLLSLARALDPRLRDRLFELVNAESDVHRYLEVSRKLQRAEDLVTELRRHLTIREQQLAEAKAAPGHCQPCTCGRRAPVQGDHGIKPAGTVAWSEHLEAWVVYAAKFSGQDADLIAARGGFGYKEITTFLGHEPTTWAPR